MALTITSRSAENSCGVIARASTASLRELILSMIKSGEGTGASIPKAGGWFDKGKRPPIFASRASKNSCLVIMSFSDRMSVSVEEITELIS